MSEFNSILSDRELRDLLQRCMLEQDSPVTEQLIEMESKIAFGTAPAALVLPNETEMIGKLTKSFAGKSGFLAWTVGLGIASILGVSVYFYANHTTPAKETAPPIEQQDAPIKENMVPAGVQPDNNNMAVVANPGLPEPEEKEATNLDNNEAVQPVTENPPAVWYEIRAEANNNTVKAEINSGNGKIEATVSGTDTSKRSVAKSSIDTVFQGVRKVVVNSSVCDLSVARVNSDQVKVKGSIVVETKGLVAKKPEYTIRHEQKGEVLNIWIDQSNKSCIVAGSVNIDGSMNIEVPSGTDVDLSNASGKVELNGLDGRLCSVKSSYGDISASKINTGFVISSGSGNITLADCNGGAELKATYGNISIDRHKGNMSVKSSSGDVTVKGLTGDKVDISSSYGNIHLSDVTSPVELSSSSGDIKLNNLKGDVSINSTYGDQTINILTGNLSTTSSSGDVKVDQLQGDLHVIANYGRVIANNCSGNMTVKSQSGDIKGKNIMVRDALDLSASYGNIHMQLNNTLDDLSFDLKALSGDIHVKKGGTDLTGDNGKLSLQKGRIKIKASTTSGDQVYE